MSEVRPVFKLKKRHRVKLEKFGSVKAHSAWHWQIRDADGCLLADWWPHTGKFRIADAEGTNVAPKNDDDHIEMLIACIVHEYPEFETQFPEYAQ